MVVSFRDAVILITGASSGIGEALARELARQPDAEAPRTLVLVARRTDRLEALKQSIQQAHPKMKVAVYSCDLNDRPATDKFLDTVLKDHQQIDILINNAGFGVGGLYDMSPWPSIENMLNLNILTLAYLTHRLVPAMIARKRGGVLNVSSGYGITFGPSMAGYIGTKHFVTGFTEGLRLDLTGTGVGVTQVMPGPTRTEFSEAMEKVSATTERVQIPEWIRVTAEHCARSALNGLRKGRARVIPGFWMNVILRSSRYIPLWSVRMAMRGRALAFRQSQAAKPAPSA